MPSHPDRSTTQRHKKWPPEDEIIPDSEEERLNQITTIKSRVSQDNYDFRVLSMSPRKGTRVAESPIIVISSSSEEEVEICLRVRESVPGSVERPVTGTTSTKPGVRNKGKRQAVPRIESESESSVIYISDTECELGPPRPSRSPNLDPNSSATNLTFNHHNLSKPTSYTPRAKPAAHSKPKAPPSFPGTPRKPKAVPPEQLRLQEYARTLFLELNATVFDGGIPPGTELVWNNRLATTAGRASCNQPGAPPSMIELSQKVVDCEERVRNTLSHEMCHLAVWIIDKDGSERGHGHKFKTWAAQVMKKRPDIKISTRHKYEINFKYTWQCCTCNKIYGRHSKSIDPEKMACGRCENGKLKALFQTRPRRTPKAASTSKHAPDSPRESPRHVSSMSTKLPTAVSVEEDEVEQLGKGLKRLGL